MLMRHMVIKRAFPLEGIRAIRTLEGLALIMALLVIGEVALLHERLATGAHKRPLS